MLHSCRRILTAIVSEQTLTDKTFYTFLVGVEMFPNNRPFVSSYDDNRDAEALTPNHLILLSGSLGQDLNWSFARHFRRCYRQATYLAGVFWSRWSREYLPTLQTRQKWLTASRDLRTGDLVLLSSDSLSRGRWPLGILVETRGSGVGKVRAAIIRTADGLVTRDIC